MSVLVAVGLSESLGGVTGGLSFVRVGTVNGGTSVYPSAPLFFFSRLACERSEIPVKDGRTLLRNLDGNLASLFRPAIGQTTFPVVHDQQSKFLTLFTVFDRCRLGVIGVCLDGEYFFSVYRWRSRSGRGR